MEGLKAIGAGKELACNADGGSALGVDQVDVVLDLAAGRAWASLLEDLCPDVRTLYLKDLSFFGCTVLQPTVFGDLARPIERGNVDPLVAETHCPKEICAAQNAFLKKSHIGKIVLTLD